MIERLIRIRRQRLAQARPPWSRTRCPPRAFGRTQERTIVDSLRRHRYCGEQQRCPELKGMRENRERDRSLELDVEQRQCDDRCGFEGAKATRAKGKTKLKVTAAMVNEARATEGSMNTARSPSQ